MEKSTISMNIGSRMPGTKTFGSNKLTVLQTRTDYRIWSLTLFNIKKTKARVAVIVQCKYIKISKQIFDKACSEE